MQVYTLVGSVDYEGDFLIAVFDSKESMMAYVEKELPVDSSDYQILGADEIHYYVSDLGQPVDYFDKVKIARRGEL